MLRRMHAKTPAPDLDDTTTESAVKHDKAAVPVWLWDDQIRFLLDVPQLMDPHLRAIAMLRNRILLRWKRNVYRSWREWWNANSTALISKCPVTAEIIRKRGNSACSPARDASFCSWDCGSSVFFWQWPEEYLVDLAIGVEPLWRAEPMQRIEKQKNLGDEAMICMISDKLQDV
ncbi:hypothetical protein ACA910_004038 [Epithemia clementina (nom. ined.)]